jgi:pimeloyl-ACP methyl ester carboxylesterase
MVPSEIFKKETPIMSFLKTSDDVKIYYEETGAGRPILFIHEFSGDFRAWELQVRYFSRRYRCVTYNARGYPPSDVPENLEMYSQRRAVDDAVDVLNHLSIEKAHIVGLSMGGFAALHFGYMYPERASSIVVGAAGMGAEPDKSAQFKQEVELVARRWETEGAEKFAPIYGSGPGREQLELKDPRGFKEFIEQLSEHSWTGAALTLRGVQARRPSPFELVAQLEKMTVPTLIIHGDEDKSCLGTGAFLKRTIRSAGLMVFPKTGHTINLEEPGLFNFALQDFFTQVESGRWMMRDKRTESGSVLLDTKS